MKANHAKLKQLQQQLDKLDFDKIKLEVDEEVATALSTAIAEVNAASTTENGTAELKTSSATLLDTNEEQDTPRDPSVPVPPPLPPVGGVGKW